MRLRSSGSGCSAVLRTSRIMRGVLPSSTSSGMSTGVAAEKRIGDGQATRVVDLADHRKRAALAVGNGGEGGERLRRHDET